MKAGSEPFRTYSGVASIPNHLSKLWLLSLRRPGGWPVLILPKHTFVEIEPGTSSLGYAWIDVYWSALPAKGNWRSLLRAWQERWPDSWDFTHHTVAEGVTPDGEGSFQLFFVEGNPQPGYEHFGDVA